MQRIWEDVRDVYCAISQKGQSTKVLDRQVKGLREKEFVQATFNKYCVEGSSQQKYWAEESFLKHVRSTTSETALSNSEIQVLWRSFCYYAYHPVPVQGLRVDFNAFKRAINLLAFQCDDLIGSHELDDWRGDCEHVWRYDESGFHSPAIKRQMYNAQIQRLFRSVGRPNAKNMEPNEEQTDFVLTDAMDILAMCGPEFLHSSPTTEQWKAMAEKLFPRGVIKRDVRREDVSMLMSLLIRLRVKKEKWGSLREFHNHGEIAEANPEYSELIDCLVNSLVGDEAQDIFTAEIFSRTMDLMLWAVLFQPLIATTHEPFVGELAGPPIHGAILLFAPQIKLERRYTRTMAEKTEEISITAIFETENMSIFKLSQGVSNLSSGAVVLFTGTEDEGSMQVTLGVYFSGPKFRINETSSTATNSLGPKGIGDGYHRYLLFQLQPIFRLFGEDSRTAFSKVIHSSNPTVSSDQVDPDASEGLHNNPYWIGKPGMVQERNSYLDVDPELRTVRLVGQIIRDGVQHGGAHADGQRLEVIVKCCTMEILAITGGSSQEFEKEEIQSSMSDILKKAQDEAAVIVVLPQSEDDSFELDREELSTRIEGFGSRGETINRENVEFPNWLGKETGYGVPTATSPASTR